MKKPFIDRIAALEQALGLVIFAGMFGAVIVQIVARYALKSPLTWPSELSIYCFIYLVYLGSAMAARRGSHVVFDIVFQRFPPGVRHGLSILGNLFIVAVILSVLPSSAEYISLIGSVRSSAMNLPWFLILVSFPFGMVLVIIHLCSWTVWHARELRRR